MSINWSTLICMVLFLGIGLTLGCFPLYDTLPSKRKKLRIIGLVSFLIGCVLFIPFKNEHQKIIKAYNEEVRLRNTLIQKVELAKGYDCEIIITSQEGVYLLVIGKANMGDSLIPPSIQVVDRQSPMFTSKEQNFPSSATVKFLSNPLEVNRFISVERIDLILNPNDAKSWELIDTVKGEKLFPLIDFMLTKCVRAKNGYF